MVREFNRKHKTNYTKEQLEMLEIAMKFRAGNLNVESMKDLALNPFINIKLDTPIPEGTEVKLNYEVLLNRKIKLSQKYVEFVQKRVTFVLWKTLKRYGYGLRFSIFCIEMKRVNL